MQKISGRFVVYFDDPFWVGVYERAEGGRMRACRITFGAEPKDWEVYAFLLENWGKLRFGPAVDAAEGAEPGNPKRARRAAGRQVHTRGEGTKAQQAVALMREETKAQRRQDGRERREEDRRARFALRQKKKKEKKKGH